MRLLPRLRGLLEDYGEEVEVVGVEEMLWDEVEGYTLVGLRQDLLQRRLFLVVSLRLHKF